MKEKFLKLMPMEMRQLLEQIPTPFFESLQEMRLRTNKELILVSAGIEHGVNHKGICQVKQGYQVKERDIQSVLKYISGFSLYALEEEVRQGYLTLEGGHRVGLVGRAVIENKEIKTLKYITGLNIRIAHEKIGCSKPVMPYIVGRDRVYHTLIISPPKCGKTTLIRDIIRQLSYGFSGYGPYTVGVVDERSEIAGCYMGVAQNDVGPRTDVLDACPKVMGMQMLLRAMAPDVIAVDEIGRKEDVYAIEEVLNAGVSILCTAHGKDLMDCYKKPGIRELIEKQMIEKIIILSHRQGPCTIEEILETSKLERKVGCV